MSKSDYRLGFFLLLGSLTAIGPLSIDMYLPSFPSIASTLAATGGAVEFTLAAFFIGLSLGQAFYGPITDRYGRKPPLYGGMALYVLATLGCALSNSIEMLIACRFVQALGGCAGMVITRAIVRDHFEAQGAARAFSLLILVMGIAPILAPIVGGGILQLTSWQGIFWCLAIYGALSLAAIHFGLEESHPADPNSPLHPLTTLKNYATLCKDRTFIGNVLAGGLAQSGMFTYITGSPFVIIELWHIPAQHFGWVFGSNAFAYILASQINSRLLPRFGIGKILRHATLAPAGFGLVLLLSGATGLGGLPLLLVGLFGYMMSLGFISPNTTASALAKQGHQAGLASALMGALQFSMATVASFIIGMIHAKTALPMTGTMALCGISSLILYRTLVAGPRSPLP